MPAPPFPLVDVTAASAPDLWTAHVRPGADQRVALHSTRAPRVEAGRQLDPIDTPPAVVALIGAGLGFVTEAARDRWPDARIVVFEPSAELARHARARTPALYASDRISLLTGPDYASDQPLWRLLDQRQGPAPAVIVHPVIARLAPEAAAAAEACARRAIQAAQMNERARQDNAPRYLLHTLRNLAVTVGGIDLTALHGRLAGVPIVVVAAGPSLDRQLPALRALEGRALVIAADTAWRPLSAAGIDPHIVVALDPTEMNGSHLLRVPARRQPWLLAELSIDPRVAPTFGARAGAFRVANHHPWPWAGTFGLGAPVIRVWGSVITACTDLALSFGGDPIVFAGADLAFTGGQPYCRGTTFEEDWARVAAQGWSLRRTWDELLASRPAAMAPDVNGAETRTAPYLVEFRDWLVARAAEHPERRFVNTTGAGILAGAHIEQMDLATIAAALPTPDRSLDEVLNAAWTPSAHPPLARTLRDALADLERSAAAADRGEDVAAPLSDWLEFGAPRLTLAAVRTALRSAIEGLDEASAAATRGDAAGLDPLRPAVDGAAIQRRRHAADRVLSMRAWLAGEPREDAPVIASVSANNGRASVEQALARLLAAESPLATGLETPAAAASDPALVPLSYRFAWTPEVMPLVAGLEETLLDAREADPRGPHAARDSSASFWRRADVPTFGPDEDVMSLAGTAVAPDVLDAAWRGSFIATTLELMPVSRESSPRWRRVCHAVARGLADARQHRTARTRARLRWRDWPIDIPVRIDALMRALTGTLVPFAEHLEPPAAAGHAWPLIVESGTDGGQAWADRDPRLLFLDPGAAHVEPDVLAQSGFVCETIDDQYARLVPRMARQTLRVDAAGRVSENAPWPDDINVEMSWGADGGTIAWSGVRSEALVRARPDAELIRTILPFRPADMTMGEGGTYWVAATGGLWEWIPGSAPRRIAESPSGAGLTLDGGHLILYPVERDPATNVMLRRRLPYAWRYDVATGRHERIETDGAGQRIKTRTRDPWTVRSYPFAGYLTLTHRDGRVLALACHAPLGIAWAGDSLLVTTMDADVLLFRGLWSVLQEWSE